jgi:excisionase family DNA binding protein
MAKFQLSEPQDFVDIDNKFLLLEDKQNKILEILNSLTVSKTSDLLSRKEASKYLKISTVTLWELTKEKVLPVVRIKSKVLYLKSDLDTFIFNQVA